MYFSLRLSLSLSFSFFLFCLSIIFKDFRRLLNGFVIDVNVILMTETSEWTKNDNDEN